MSRRILPLLLSLLLLLTTSVGPAAAQDAGPTYIVQSGDTLTGIARTFGTTVNALIQVNGLASAGAIQPGQELVIPGLPEVEGVLTTERVLPGDNLVSFAWRYGHEPATLARLNRIVHSERLYVGQTLILAAADEEGAQARSGQGHLVRPGESQLVHAVRNGANPWLAALEARSAPRRWWVPGEIIPVRSPDEGPYRGLPPGLQDLRMAPTPVAQGETLVAEAELREPTRLSGDIGGHPLRFMEKSAEEWVALQGIDALAEPGLHELVLRFEPESEGASYAFRQPYPVRSGNYPLGPVLAVPEETLRPENIGPEEEVVAEVLAPATEEKLWEGRFEFPSNYYTEDFPSYFGVRRNYNNQGYNWYHTGLDFYGGEGIEILAPAPGDVVLSEELTVRGGTTILDHGWGVYTLYMHQSELLVEEGDVVETGDVIGRVGATGRVTGPHLHWEVRVGGVPVQPLDWVETAYPPDL